MTRTDKQRARLINLLKELFQLDQPDLDFGFYKIMHAKAGRVSEFLQNGLLGIIMNNTDCVLVIWRKLTGNLEEDNLMLDEWFKKHYPSSQGSKLDVIYINGSNNLANLCPEGERWQVRLIEEAFHQQMWNAQA